jgi:hypothetical protein
MENLEWKPVYYNGLETNVEVTKCGKVKKVQKEWYGKGNGAYKIKYGEIDFNSLKTTKFGYKGIAIQIKGLKRRTVMVHQLIVAAFLDYKFEGNKIVVEHIDTNPVNNKLGNLKIITMSEHNRTHVKKLKKTGKKRSLPKGVVFRKETKKYRAQMTLNKKHYHLGYYNTPEEASQAYQNKLKSLSYE